MRRYRSSHIITKVAKMVQVSFVFSRLLTILCCCKVTVNAVVAREDLFLFAGQSNMIGWSVGVMSIEGNDRLQNDTFGILANTSITETERRSMLLARFQMSESSVPWATNPLGIAAAQADGVMSLVQQNLTVGLQAELAGAYCSFTEPGRTSVAKRLVTATACGITFGHELVFSHRLKQCKPYKNRDFFTVKVARGGSRIQEWVPDGGAYWKDLQSAIRDSEGDWKLIVWHQGENNAIDPPATINQTIYANHLNHLITALRSEIFAKSSGAFPCPQAIPVIIVQIHFPTPGLDPFREQSRAIRQAQADFVANDPRSRLVVLSDLEEHYHLSVPALLISGNRIAEAYLDLMKSYDYSCPPPSNTPSGLSPATPYGTPSSTPSYLPTSTPSETPSTKPVPAKQPDFSNTGNWGEAIRKACGCRAMFTTKCVRSQLRQYFQSDVDAGLVQSPDDRPQWRGKVRAAYESACQRRSHNRQD